MTTTDETARRFWSIKNVFLFIVLPVAVLAGVVIGFIPYAQAPVASSEEPAIVRAIKSEYGAEQVIVGRGLLFITVGGKQNVCPIVSEQSVAHRETIKCSGMVTIAAKG